jgi:hypothetical protein
MGVIRNRRRARYLGWYRLPREDLQEGGRCSALFPSVVLAFDPSGLSRSTLEENARASYLVG